MVLASPPCQGYSVANTTGSNRFEEGMIEADKNVEVVKKIILHLDVVLGIVD